MLGMTMFHETLHMTSAIVDHGYAKSTCLDLAKNKPADARLTASNYVYFAAENGYSRADYKKYNRKVYTRDGTK